MVNKVEIGTLTQVSNNEHNFLKALNQNFTAIQKAINDTLSRTGVTPNEMNEVLDMNGKRVINIGSAIEATDAVTKQDIQDIIDAAQAAIGRIDDIIVAAKQALEAYAQEYIYPIAQQAVTDAVAAKNAAEAARDALLNDPGYQKLIQNLDELVELADHATELQAIIDNIDALLAVAESIEDIKDVAENLSGLKSIVDNMQEILQASTYASQAAASASAASTAASTATSEASTATTKASEAAVSATAAAGSATTASSAASTATTKASEAAASATQADAAVTAAGTSAQQASTSATHALIWAEGDDESVEALGGEHSAKGWAEIAGQAAGGVIEISGDSGVLTDEQMALIGPTAKIINDGEVFTMANNESSLSYVTFVNGDVNDSNNMSFKAIYVNTSTVAVNYKHWTKEDVQSGGVSSVGFGDLTGTYEDNAGLKAAIDGKQGTLTAGTNITLAQDGTISATDTTYTAGTNITIDANNVISATGGSQPTYDAATKTIEF